MAIGVSIAAHVVVLVWLARAPAHPTTAAARPTLIVVGTVLSEVSPPSNNVAAADTRAAPAPKANAQAGARPHPNRRIAVVPAHAATAVSAAPAVSALPAVHALPAVSALPAVHGDDSEGSGGREHTGTAASATGGGDAAAGDAVAGGNVDTERIRRAIESAIRYPRLARRRQLTGRVTVRFFVDEKGAPTRLQIVSSVHPLLESAARKAVDRASPYAKGIGWIRVPIDFSLSR